MKIRLRRPWKLLAVATVPIVIGALVVAAFALAAAPKHGTYAGITKQNEVSVEFTVPKSLGKVHGLTSGNLPTYCEGGGIPTQTLHWKDAKVKNGKFTSTVKEKVNGSVVATGTISGKFLAGGKERGVMKTVFPKIAECGGSTTYTTQLGGAL